MGEGLDQDQWAISTRLKLKDYMRMFSFDLTQTGLKFTLNCEWVWHFLLYKWASWLVTSHRKPTVVSLFILLMPNTTVVKRENPWWIEKTFLGFFHFLSRCLQILVYFRLTSNISYLTEFCGGMRLINEYSLIGNPNPPWEEKPDSLPS